jgi:hypothetical protein
LNLAISPNPDLIHHTHPSKTFSLPSKNTTNLLLFAQSPWLNLLTDQKNLTSTNPKPSTVTEMVLRSSYKNVKVYMDINHETYNNNLRKIAFVLSFMTTGSAAIWKAQFIEEAYAKPAPANPNDRLGTYTQFRKDLIEAFSMFNSVGNALDELRSLRKKKTELIDKHIAKFKVLAAKSKIDTTNPLSIKLFKETLPWALTLQLMKLETLLKIIDNWYKWAASLNH